jgi:hypothetical protein
VDVVGQLVDFSAGLDRCVEALVSFKIDETHALAPGLRVREAVLVPWDLDAVRSPGGGRVTDQIRAPASRHLVTHRVVRRQRIVWRRPRFRGVDPAAAEHG